MYLLMDQRILDIAARNQEKARRIVAELDIEGIWESVGAEPDLVGSLRTGLLVKHRDIDFHIYSPELDLSIGFSAMAQLSRKPGIERMEFANLIHTPEQCVEWHAWYRDSEGDLWQIDMIHILKGSRYDGYFERVADRISAALTPEIRGAIILLKYQTPDTDKIPGIAYYQAVMRDGVRDYDAFRRWLEANPVDGVIEWMP